MVQKQKNNGLRFAYNTLMYLYKDYNNKSASHFLKILRSRIVNRIATKGSLISESFKLWLKCPQKGAKNYP